MEVVFRTKKLERCFRESKLAAAEFGEVVGRRYIQRINIIRSSRNIEDLKAQRSLRCHPLKGDRKGQWAINLTNRYRLLFSLHGQDARIVRIEEVSNHYDD